MSHGPIKSLYLSGNLKVNGTISVQIPFDEFRNKLWQLAILDVGYETLESLNIIAKISVNFITDVQYNSQGYNYNFIHKQI